MNRSLFALVIALCAACDNKSSGPAPAASSAAPQPSATVASSASAAPSASTASSAAAEGGAWAGTYKSGPGTVTLPVGKAYEGATWANDDGGVGVGEGALTINVDPSGVVSGSGEGALGAFLLDGVVKDGQLSATVARKDPSDRGLTGTLLGKVTGDKIDGTMNLSLPEASGVRKATFSLAKK